MKIAVVGSAPSSVSLAPYSDPSWTIFGCSPAGVPAIKRCDEWFELHHWTGPNRFPTDYLMFMAMFKGPVWMIEKRPEISKSINLDLTLHKKEFGPYFFTSTIAYMLAEAILREPKEIGIFGVDMQASGEYEHQRPGCHYFIQEAERRGIKVTVPPESDIIQPPPFYGFCEADPKWQKMLSKSKELKQRIANAKETARASELHAAKLEGADQMLEYFRRTWA